MLAAADTYVVVLALTDMMAGVGLGIESLQRATPIISGFLLGYIAALPLIGRLADLLGHSRVLLGCLVIFVAGSVVTALAVELPVLVAGRFIQGVGGGGLVPATLAIVAALWPAERRSASSGRCRRWGPCWARSSAQPSSRCRGGGPSSGSTPPPAHACMPWFGRCPAPHLRAPHLRAAHRSHGPPQRPWRYWQRRWAC